MSDRRLLFLGIPRLEVAGTVARVERRKAVALLAYLAVTRAAFTREALAAMFWADTDLSGGLAYLRTTLWSISKVIGDDWVALEQDSVRFNGEAGVFIDVPEFEALAARDDQESLEAAVQLVRGDFLNGFNLKDSPAFEEWQFFQTEALRRTFAGVLDRLVTMQLAAGGDSRTVELARRAVTLDPLNEAAHRLLMRAYAASGQHAAALRQYREVSRLLNSELGAAPEAETTALYNSLLKDRVSVAELTPARPPAISASESPAPVYTPLPVPSVPLVGRQADVQEIARLLNDADCRLLTLVGPGGIGKTRLAIEAARLLEPQDMCFVALAPVHAAEFVLPTIAAALGFTSGASADYQRRLVSYLRDRRMLLVMDNFEHVVSAAEFVSELLKHAPGIKVLATSRERLNLPEEWAFEVAGLAYPPAQAVSLPTISDVTAYSAVELFVQCARRVRPAFTISARDVDFVIQICRAVEGMPLGVELAAAWVQILTCEEIAQQLHSGLDLLTTSRRGIDERHRSMRAVFEQSWSHLSVEEQQVLSTLAIFHGGFTLDAAQQVAGASLPLLLSLSNKSLLRRVEARYDMHELLRQFAEQKLTNESRASADAQHAAYYAGFLEARTERLKGRDQRQALDEIEAEIDNIRVAWCNAAVQRNIDLLQHAILPLVLYATVRGSYLETLELLIKALGSLNLAGDEPAERLLIGQLLAYKAAASTPSSQMSAISEQADRALAVLHEFPNQLHAAHALSLIGQIKGMPELLPDASEAVTREAQAIFEAHNDAWGVAWCRLLLAECAHGHIRYDESIEIASDALARFQQIGNPWGIAMTLGTLGRNQFTLGNFHESARLYNEARQLLLAIKDRYEILWYEFDISQDTTIDDRIAVNMQRLRETERAGDTQAVATALYDLGWCYLYREDYEVATDYLKRGLALYQSLDNAVGASWTLIYLGQVEVECGHADAAFAYVNRALDTISRVDYPWVQCGARYVLGHAALLRGDLIGARQHFAEAVQIAYRVRSVMQTVRHLAGFAALLLAEGDVPAATRVAAFAKTHPASWLDIKKTAQRVLDAAQGQLPADSFGSEQVCGESYDLDEIVAELLSASEA